MNAKLFEERTVFKVLAAARVEWICIHSDFYMPPSGCFACMRQAKPYRRAVRLSAGHCRKRWVSPHHSVPVSPRDPSSRAVGVPTFGPYSETRPDDSFCFPEGFRCDHVAMIVSPSPNNRVEQSYQIFLFGRTVPTDNRPNLFKEGVRVLLRRLDQELAAIFADVLAQEVESLFDVRDASFLWRELQAPVVQKLLNQRLDFVFQQFLGAAGNDEVIRVSYEAHFRIAPLPLDHSPAEFLLQQPFQSIQCQVGQRGRDYPALWRSRLSGEEGSILDEASFQPFTQHFFISNSHFDGTRRERSGRIKVWAQERTRA